MYTRYDTGYGHAIEVFVEEGRVRWVGWLLGPLADDWYIGTQSAEEFLTAPLRDDLPDGTFGLIAAALGHAEAPQPAPRPVAPPVARAAPPPRVPDPPRAIPVEPPPTEASAPIDPHEFVGVRLLAKEIDRLELLALAGAWMAVLAPEFVAAHPADVAALGAPQESSEAWQWRLEWSRPEGAGWSASTLQEEDGKGVQAANRVHRVEAVGMPEGLSFVLTCGWTPPSASAGLRLACRGPVPRIAAVRRHWERGEVIPVGE